jgi:hypothetical protein
MPSIVIFNKRHFAGVESIHFKMSFREEMEDVVGSVFDLVGRTSDPILEEEVINERVNRIFQVTIASQ